MNKIINKMSYSINNIKELKEECTNTPMDVGSLIKY